MVVDIERAFLNGLCTRGIYIELPGEASQGGKFVGKLVKALYGTRDAPLAWQLVVKGDMRALGFQECKVANGVFTHRVRDLRAVAHVDDFLVSGESQDLAWFRSEMAKTYELKVQISVLEQGDEDHSVSLAGPSGPPRLEWNSKEMRNT